MNNVFLLLGSNLGDRSLYLNKAIAHIEEYIAPVIKISSVYETQSWGKTDAPDYLNQVICFETDLSPQSCLKRVLDIETVMGRQRIERYGSRTIDIDILFYGQAVINEEGLHIPHQELHKRRFTLEPLAEIAPDFIHPVLNLSVLQIKSELKDSLTVKKLYV